MKKYLLSLLIVLGLILMPATVFADDIWSAEIGDASVPWISNQSGAYNSTTIPVTIENNHGANNGYYAGLLATGELVGLDGDGMWVSGYLARGSEVTIPWTLTANALAQEGNVDVAGVFWGQVWWIFGVPFADAECNSFGIDNTSPTGEVGYTTGRGYNYPYIAGVDDNLSGVASAKIVGTGSIRHGGTVDYFYDVIITDYAGNVTIIPVEGRDHTPASGNYPMCEKCWSPLHESDYTNHEYVVGGRIYTCPFCGFSNEANQLGYLNSLATR